MTLEASLAARKRTLSEYVERIHAVLEADDRVQAAWLTGSLARGDSDDLSDIDLVVVVSDSDLTGIVTNRYDFVAQVGTPVLLLENPQNAPPGGAYLLALYPGEAGPMHVDWFLEPLSGSRVPDDAEVLFDRYGLRIIAGDEWRALHHSSPDSNVGFPVELPHPITQQITFFWAMSVIVAKYIARRDGKTVERMMRVVAAALDDVEKQAGIRAIAVEPRSIRTSGIESATPEQQFSLLRSFSTEALSLHRQIVAAGQKVPAEAVPHILRFFDLTEAMTRT